MWMFSTCVYKQFLVHLTAKAVFRKHAFYCSFDHVIRATLKKILCSFFFLTSWISAEVQVDLFFQFVTGKFYFIGIKYDYEISAIYVWSVIRLVLAAENR